MNNETQTQVPGEQVEKTNKPVKTYTCKGGVQATIWMEVKEKDGRKFDAYSVNITRRYLKEDGNVENPADWKSTSSMRTDDLPKIAIVADQAYKYIVMKQM